MPGKHANQDKTSKDMVKALGELGVDLSGVKEVRNRLFVAIFLLESSLNLRR